MNWIGIVGWLLLIIFYPYGEANAYVDGLKLRLGSYVAEHHVGSDLFELNDKDKFSQVKFPIMIDFRPKVNAYWFRQFFFDYELPYSSQNMNPDSINRTRMVAEFFDADEIAFTTTNPDWDLTADIETWSIVGGIQWGLFYPYSSETLLFRTALGLTFGWYNYDVDIYLCSTYTSNSRRISNSSKTSGDCEDKTRVDGIDYSGIGLGVTVNFGLYQWIGQQWAVTAFEAELGSIAAFGDRELNRSGAGKLDITTTLISLDIVRVSYFFN